MDDLKQRIDELAGLMEEFSLLEAQMNGPDWKIAFRRGKRPEMQEESAEEADLEIIPISHAAVMPPEAKPVGIPVNSPMNGIYYASPSPSAPAFVKVGESVSAGQVIALIEAMKVFNEIVAPVSGIVDRVVAENGQLVQPGDALLFIA